MEIILVVLVLGVIPGMIASSKEKSFVLWWLYGVLIFPVALVHSILTTNDGPPPEIKQLQTGAGKRCSYCAEVIKSEANVCRFCGRDVVLVRT